MCKTVEDYTDKRLQEQQDAILKKLVHRFLLEGRSSVEEIAEMCNTSVEHVEKVREELEEELVPV